LPRKPARLSGGSSAWRAGWTGSPGALSRNGRVSRRAAVRQARAGRPGWWSCRSTSSRWPGRPCRVELRTQDAGESAFAGFDDGAGVVCDQPAQQGVGVLGVAPVPGAIELVQAGGGEAGRSRCRAARRRLRAGRRPRREPVPGRVPGRRRPGRGPQRRGSGSQRSARASCSPHDASVFMRPRLDSRGGTFTDAAGRLKTSCSASGPSSGTAGLSEADWDLSATGILLAFGRSAEIQTGILSEDLGLQVCAPRGLWHAAG
jgi:hypothetical protein